MTLINASFRHAGAQQLAQSLQAARQNTLSLFDCYISAGLDVVAGLPHHPRLNPPLWQLAHIAWFAEWYILREAASSHPGDAVSNCLLTRGDDLFDANMVEHRARWKLELPSPGAVKTYCREVLDRVLDKLSRVPNVDTALAPYRLALAHEDLCCEEMLTGLQWLGLEAPQCLSSSAVLPPGAGEITFPGKTTNWARRAGPGLPSTMSLRLTAATWRRFPSMLAPYQMPSLPILSPMAATRTASSGARPAAPG